jgi:UPF0716 protein FxsA
MTLFERNAKRWPFAATALCWRRKEKIMGVLALFLLIILPVIEIYLFVEIGGALGAAWTILLIFLTAALGLSALRQQGLAVLQEAQKARNSGRAPLAAVAHGLLILLGGGLLLLPGFFTDTVGLLCLLRPVRLFLISAALEALLPQILRMRPRGNSDTNAGFGAPPRPEKEPPHTTGNFDNGKTIEGDYRIEDAIDGTEEDTKARKE